MAVYRWYCRALGQNLICFQRFVGFVVGFLDDFRAFGVKGKEIGRGLLGDNSSIDVLEDLQSPYTSSSLALTL